MNVRKLSKKNGSWSLWGFVILAVLMFSFIALTQKKGQEKQMNKKNPKQNTIKVYDSKKGEYVYVEKVEKAAEQWKKELTPLQYEVIRKKGTERPFTGKYEHNEAKGLYRCAGCGLDLFDSGSKFDSGCGWPSFSIPVSDQNIAYLEDNSLYPRRVEIQCPRCGGHLGHVFNDGPGPTGLRYCVNSASLDFESDSGETSAAKETAETPRKALKKAKATFAAGCFWGVEAAFRQIKGVTATAVGYIGGTTKNPTYREVCTGSTGHAEAVQVEYDPGKVSYEKLLAVFWKNHDPTTLNRQGPDVGEQYRSVIFYHDEKQKELAAASKAQLEIAGVYRNPIVTEIVPAGVFYRAEEYHQRYLEKRGLSTCKIK